MKKINTINGYKVVMNIHKANIFDEYGIYEINFIDNGITVDKLIIDCLDIEEAYNCASKYIGDNFGGITEIIFIGDIVPDDYEA